MDYSELRKELNNFSFEETRRDSEDYFEVVVTKSELAKVTPVLEKFFGPPVLDQGKLSAKAQQIVKKCGGIMSGQTLYLIEQGDVLFLAMLWPWGAGSPITIKLGKP